MRLYAEVLGESLVSAGQAISQPPSPEDGLVHGESSPSIAHNAKPISCPKTGTMIPQLLDTIRTS